MGLNNLILFLFLACAFANSANAQSTDKSQYNFFHPTPADKMRDLAPGENPYTVDAGHFQIESELMSVSWNKVKAADEESQSSSYLATALKIGLTNSIDVQLIYSPYIKEQVKTAGVKSEDSGAGDTFIRMKFNLVGNDEGDIALALTPFVKLPTAAKPLGNGKYEGGINMPVGLSLPYDWGMDLLFQVNHTLNSTDDNYHAEYISLLNISHDIAGDLAGFVEFVSLSSEEPGSEWIGTFNATVTYGFTPDLQLDLGLTFGTTPAAADLKSALLLTARF